MVFGRALLLCFVVWSCEGNFWETVVDVNERFQKVPTVAENREKLMKYFLNRKVPRHRRFTPYHDVVFAFDSSSDISQKDFNLSIAAAKKLIRCLDPDTLVSSVSFAANTIINFNFSSAETATDKLGDLMNQGGKKDMSVALRTIRKELLLNRHSGVRMGSDKSVLIMTNGPAEEFHDGRELRRFLFATFMLKTLGNEVFLVAAGERIPRIQEFVYIPSSTDAHFYRVFNMTQFKQVVDSIPQHIVYQDFELIE